MDIRPDSVIDGPAGLKITIGELLGSGGFGQVFKGTLSDGVTVAVKTVLTGSLSPSDLLTLQNEAKLATAVEHPNVARVLYVNDGKSTGDAPYLVLEFVDGGNLRELLEAKKAAGDKLSESEARAICLQIAEGMAAINAKIVHRDLKPENVLVSKSGEIKIADFGLAKLADAATRSETFKGWGTRPYQSPEAFEAGPNTTAMDVYSAGVLFFELASGVWPVEPKLGDSSPMAWRNAHLITAPKDLRLLRPDFALPVVQLVGKMLEKNPAKRPAWPVIVDRLRSTELPAGAPDVNELVAKATDRFHRETAAAAHARDLREQEELRTSLLVSAFQEPVNVLRELVETFNAQSELGKLGWKESTTNVKVVGLQHGVSLDISGRPMRDLDLGSRDGIVRMIGTVRVDPTPSPSSERDYYQNPQSFGGFNLLYILRNEAERFGEWKQIRFEMSPLLPHAEFPHWHELPTEQLLHELRILHAMGHYQHELRPLSTDWFRTLLAQIV